MNGPASSICAALCGAALVFGVAATAQERRMEVLQLQLPKPMFAGTPRNLRTPNLEPLTGKPREPFLVPVGTVLLSVGKPVKASDRDPIIGEIAYVTDGRNSGDDGSYVELGPRLQWVQIDLGRTCSLTAIVVWHYHNQPRVYFDVVVQASDDTNFMYEVKTLLNNDHDNSSGLGLGRDKEYVETSEGRLIDGRGVNARYVRLYSAGNTSNEMNHYVEVQVFGIAGR
jgi:hypothetical protein